MSHHNTSGVATLCLFEGPEEGRVVTLEIERAEIVAVVCWKTGEELPLTVVSSRDWKTAMDAIELLS